MIVTVALIVIGIIAAIFVALFAIRVRVDLEMSDELHLSVLAFGIKIKILPKKPKKYKLSNYTPKKIAKRDRIAAEKAAKKAEAAKQKKAAKEQKKKDKEDREAKLTKADKKAIKAKKKASRPPIPDMISLFSRILKIFFSGLFSKFHFHVARIKIDIGSDNAATTAMMCVGIRTAIRPVLNFLAKHSNLHGMRRAEISVTPNYLSEEIKADVKLGFSTSLGGILGVAIRAGFSFIFGWFKIKPTVPPEIERAAQIAEAKLGIPEDGHKGKPKKKNKKDNASDTSNESEGESASGENQADQSNESNALPSSGEDQA